MVEACRKWMSPRAVLIILTVINFLNCEWEPVRKETSR